MTLVLGKWGRLRCRDKSPLRHERKTWQGASASRAYCHVDAHGGVARAPGGEAVDQIGAQLEPTGEAAGPQGGAEEGAGGIGPPPDQTRRLPDMKPDRLSNRCTRPHLPPSTPDTHHRQDRGPDLRMQSWLGVVAMPGSFVLVVGSWSCVAALHLQREFPCRHRFCAVRITNKTTGRPATLQLNQDPRRNHHGRTGSSEPDGG